MFGVTFTVNESQFGACEIFREASSETIKYLCSEALAVSYAQNEQIYIQDEESDDFHLIVSGSVRARGYSADGKAVIHTDIGPGELFGEFAALDNKHRSAGVSALEDVFALKMPSRALQFAIENDGKVAMRLVLSLVEKNRLQSERVFEFSVYAVRKRVQQEILRLIANETKTLNSEPKLNSLLLKIPTHRELAERLSTHREAVTRELSFLNKVGLVKTRKTGLEIPDLERFKMFAEDPTE